MRLGLWVGICVLALCTGCSFWGAGEDTFDGYSALPDSCTLISPENIKKYIGSDASPVASDPPEVQPGDAQSQCDWRYDSRSNGLSIGTRIFASENGGVAQAKALFLERRESFCQDSRCRDISALGSAAFVEGDALGAGSPEPGEVLHFLVRDKNIILVITYTKSVSSAKKYGSGNLELDGLAVAREAVRRIQASGQ
ncbi:hypothetical protein [Actinomadura sp. WMMB 499]|uniref:hypothetical protein n=1 Tax=Actinomadura sp. WMMB 499 TaxID=1219491 RepID=UPI00124790E4|nr:hypothetical protein [Actinomadura sp. WMMB 499]QFG21669.1 hypothetical protein F7P10_11500 [Actinomadura sp. WMMB 499]